MKTNREDGNVFVAHQMDSSTLTLPSSMPESLLPLYQSSRACDPKQTSVNKSDSGLTCNILPAPRKRHRDSMMGHHDFNANSIPSQKTKLSGVLSLLDNDIVSQIQLQQSEIDRFIVQHVIFILYSYF